MLELQLADTLTSLNLHVTQLTEGLPTSGEGLAR